MASEDRDSFPDGFAIPLFSKVKKRIAKYVLFVRLTAHVNHLEKERNALLKKQSEQLSNVVMRKCWLCLRIITPTPTVYWHTNCYASYTSKQSIRHATPGDRLKQTSQQDKDGVISTWTFQCLICKNKTYKKSRNLTVCIFEACQGIRSVAHLHSNMNTLFN